MTVNTAFGTMPETSDFRLFSPQELPCVQAAMRLVEEHHPTLLPSLQDSETRLQRLGQLLSEYPSLSANSADAPLQQSVETLLDTLIHLNPLEMKLRMPTKALLADSYLMAKTQHIKDLLAVIAELPAPAERPELHRQLSHQIEHIIHTYLLGQLLIDVILNQDISHQTKQVAAKSLLSLWDQYSDHESLSEFFMMIRSLWDARLHIQVLYGTLMGTSELFQLLEAECDPVILQHFTESELSEAEGQAFEEFLFGLSYEEIKLLRTEMKKRDLSVIGKQQVADFLGCTLESLHPTREMTGQDPHLIYRSYKRRRFQCRYRSNTGSLGPRKTAEEFLVLSLLDDLQE